MRKIILVLVMLFSMILVACSNVKIELLVPSFTITEDGNVIIKDQENTNTYGFVVNDEKERIITFGESIKLNDGDCIKIKAISENDKKYVSSEYSETKKYIKKVLLNKIEIVFNNDGKVEIASELMEAYNEIYLELNDEVIEITLQNLYQYEFKYGDTIRIKYKSIDNDKYIENEWSNKLIKTLNLPVISFEIEEQKIKITSELLENYDSFALMINNEIEFLTYDELISKDLKVGDLVQIKYVSINKDVYIENEWSEIVTVIGVFPKLSFSITDGKAKFDSAVLSNYFPIWINVNGSISQCHLKTFIERTFDIGDKVSIKYRYTEGCNYIENEWSEVAVAKVTLPYLDFKITEGEIVYITELYDEYQTIIVELNGSLIISSIEEFTLMDFSKGDSIRIKYKSTQELYLENKWSSLVVFE